MTTTTTATHPRRVSRAPIGDAGERSTLDVADGLGLEPDLDPVLTPWRRSHRVTLRAALDVPALWW